MNRKGMVALCMLVLGMVLLFAMIVAVSAADVGNYAYAAGVPSYTVSIANTDYRVAGGGILHITLATPDVIWPSINKTVYVNDPPLTLGDLNGGSAIGVNGVSLKGDFIMEQGALGSWTASGSQLLRLCLSPKAPTTLM